MEQQEPAAKYSMSSKLFEEMNRLRRAWHGFHPAPPLKRSDLAVMGAVSKLLAGGHRPLTVSALARAMKQSVPGISQKLSFLEQKGYLKRVEDQNDRRRVYVELTPKGEEIASGALREFLGRVDEALDKLGPEKTRQLIERMRDLSDAMETMAKEEKQRGLQDEH